MTLADLLPSIAHNPKLYLKIIDSDSSSLISFEAAGYQAINAEISARDVDKITIAEEEDVIKIFLKEVPELPDPEPEPDNPDNPQDPSDPSNNPDPNQPQDPSTGG